jgi:tetratricopeptide (TPR) repeat protein
MERVCDAVQYAHSRGVIHRDLKPENIIVTPAGEPKVLDFGIARLIVGTDHGGVSPTLPGILLGTAAYMSPEQAGGEGGGSGAEGIDTRSDVYSLGAILYHLLSGRAPVETADRPLAEVLADVHRGEMPRLSSIAPRVRGDVEAIVQKAMARDRRDRYASASELGAELARAIAGEPVLARPPTAAQQLGRLARAHPRTMVAAAAVLAIGVVGIVMLERTRARAEENFLAASNAADVLLNQVIDRLGPMAGTLETRRRIVAELRVPVERFAAARPDDSRLRYNYARLLDAEADLASHDREWSRALALRNQAATIMSELCSQESVSRQWRETQSLVLVKTGDIVKTIGRTDEAVGLYGDALAVDEELVEQLPDDPTLNDNLYWSYMRLVECLAGSDPERAKEFQSRARRQAERLYAISPDRAGSIYVKLTQMSRDAVASSTVGDSPSPETLGVLQERLRLGQRLQTISPNNRGHMMRVAGDLGFAAMMYQRMGNLAEAERLWRSSRALIEPMFKSDPGDLGVLEHYAANCGIAAELALARGDRESRVCWFREVATARRESMSFAGTPGNDRAPTLCEALIQLARELRAVGEPAEAAACEEELLGVIIHYWRTTESPLFVDRFVAICATGQASKAIRAENIERVAAEVEEARPGSAVPQLLRAAALKRRGDLTGARALWQDVQGRSDDCGRFARNELRDSAAEE